MRSSFGMGRIAGIDINIHISWLLIFALLSWSLATDFFPSRYHFSAAAFWLLGLVSAFLLFVCVLLHELAHSLVSKRNKMKVDSITLFFFGGVSNIHSDSPDAKTEFKMAIAGPLTSVVLGVIAYFIFLGTTGYLKAIFDYLYFVNLILAAFNMIPGYPLDGGRVLRSALWTYYKDVKKATKIAATAGTVFGYLMIAFGIINILFGSFEIWYVLLGAFLIMLAKAGYQQVLIKDHLNRLKLISLIAKTKLLEEDMTVHDFLEWCEKNNQHFGVIKENKVYYVIDISAVAKVHKEAWLIAKVSNLMRKVSPVNLEKGPEEVLEQMRNDNVSIVPIEKAGKFIGVVTEEALGSRLRVMALKDK